MDGHHVMPMEQAVEIGRRIAQQEPAKEQADRGCPRSAEVSLDRPLELVADDDRRTLDLRGHRALGRRRGHVRGRGSGLRA